MAELSEAWEQPAQPGQADARRDHTDRELLREARAGSRSATEAIVERYWDKAHRIAFGVLGDRHIAEDVTQESMLSILANLSRFDTRRPFEPWLHRIVTNRAVDWARARERREKVATLVQPNQQQQPLPQQELVEALGALPVEQRAAVVLRYVAGYGTNEIARILGVQRGTVGSRIRRGLDRLRIELEDQNG